MTVIIDQALFLPDYDSLLYTKETTLFTFSEGKTMVWRG